MMSPTRPSPSIAPPEIAGMSRKTDPERFDHHFLLSDQLIYGDTVKLFAALHHDQYGVAAALGRFVREELRQPNQRQQSVPEQRRLHPIFESDERTWAPAKTFRGSQTSGRI